MKLTKIEIFGFKSFYNRTVITPGDNITAIVGPNGCGKSNVADAIRWVMGEQSSKILRGASMSDVIFNGTAKRKSLSYCEVSLSFDNLDGSMPIEYGEVIITRKLYRSGESEYLINGKNVRLKDITGLIRASKMGRDGYSIIGQGKVEEFINAKPEERRHLFDEATGIAASKQKRAESERKLARTEENLIRYKDILQEIDRTLEPLKEQAKDAKEYFSLKEKLKYSEVNYYIHKKDTRDKEVEAVRKRIAGIEEELSQKEQVLQRANAEYAKVLEDMGKADDEVSVLREKQLDFSLLKEKEESKRKLHTQKIDFLQSQQDSLAEQTARLEKSLADGENKRKQLHVELQELLSKKQELGEDAGKLTLDLSCLRGQADGISRKVEEFERWEKENIYSASDIASEIAKLDFESESIAVQALELSERKAELEEEISQKSRDREKAQQKSEEIENEIACIAKSRFEGEAGIAEWENKLAKINSNVASCDKFIAESGAREKMLKELQNSYEGYSSAVKRLMKDAENNEFLKSRIEGTVAELIKVPKGLEMAVEAALQNAFQNVVVPCVADAKSHISYLRNNNYGQVTFLPLDTVKPRFLREDQVSVLSDSGVLGICCDLVSFDAKYQTAMESLLGAVVVVEDIDAGIAVQKKYRSGFKIVTKLGEIFATSGSVTGGSQRQGAGNVLSYQNKLEELAESMKSAIQKKEEYLNLAVLLQGKIAKQKSQVLELSSRLQKLEVAKAQGIELQKSSAIAEQRGVFELRGVDQKCEMASGRLLEIEGEVKRLETAKSSMQEVGEKQASQIEKLKADLIEKSAEIEKLATNLASCNLEIAKVDGEYANAKQREASLLESISQDEFLLASCDNNYEKIKAEIKELQGEVFEEIDDLYIASLKEQIARYEAGKKTFSENLQKLDVQKNVSTVEVEKLSAKKQSLLESIADNSELAMLYDGILVEYGELDFQKEKDENYNPSGAKGIIKKLKSDIFALGNINTQAIEEYAKQSARHSEMTQHKEDMEKASDDLKRVIQNLNSDMSEMFSAEFEKIGANFNQIFTELFGGGNAKLSLIQNQSEDKLSYGIDIEAKPPGKTLQSMTLLSGGEKALTAIAIIIAIMRARPMPFCVFDEIEAALDDVNARRFASYIKNFSDPTQFVIITHKKSTMEVASNLFGVTMEEKGLSKLVSVSIGDVS